MLSFSFIFFITFGGCDLIRSFTDKKVDEKTEDRQSIEQASASLKDNNLPAALSQYEAAVTAHPTDVEAATGGAYVAMLKGDLDKADQLLATAQEQAGEDKGKILLRRTIIAIRGQKFEDAKKYALASGLDMGKLFAAEIALGDDEVEEAKELLESIADATVKELADDYLVFLKKEDMWFNLISASQAMWALGDHKAAVRSITKPLEKVSFDKKEEQKLLWSGRAVSIGEIDIAKALLPKSSSIRNKDVRWRVLATSAIISCAEKQLKKCKKSFEALQGKAPQQGIIDAKITAASLIVDSHPGDAKELVAGYESNAAAQVLFQAGDTDAAKDAANSGVYSTYLQEGG